MKKIIYGLMVCLVTIGTYCLIVNVADYINNRANAEGHGYLEDEIFEINSSECKTIDNEEIIEKLFVLDGVEVDVEELNAQIIGSIDDFETEDEWRSYWELQLHIH